MAAHFKMSWAALQEAVIHDNADARFVAKKCMRWNTDYKRQLVLEDMYFRKQIPESLRDLLAPHITKDPFQDAFSVMNVLATYFNSADKRVTLETMRTNGELPDFVLSLDLRPDQAWENLLNCYMKMEAIFGGRYVSQRELDRMRSEGSLPEWMDLLLPASFGS